MDNFKKFEYTKTNGEKKNHWVFVTTETSEYLMGIDVDSYIQYYIDNSNGINTGIKIIEAYESLKKSFENKEPREFESLQEMRSVEKEPIKDFDPAWGKSFRNFKKSGISNLS